MARRPKTPRRPPPARDRAEISISFPAGGVGISPARLRGLIEYVASAEGQAVAAVDLAVVGSGQMASLNRRWLGRRQDTDVLSFDLSDADRTGISGQIVVSSGAAARQGPPHGHTAEEELMLYVVHGLLHLMGYDDTSARAAAKMHARQEELLEAFGRRRRKRKK